MTRTALRAVMPAMMFWAPAPAAADTEILGEEGFRALAEGQTLWFEQGGVPFGAEQYFDGGRTLWRPEGGLCEYGIWYEQDGAICFVYENGTGPQCWQVLRRDGEVFARSLSDPSGLAELKMSRRDQQPLDCPGPSVGA
ncbi:MAG: hypothetical protein AAGC92_01905 [Pseudomonadota bacterium]